MPPSAAEQNAVTTIDALKLAAVVLMVVDHAGLFFIDSNWPRIAGRPVAIIFGFLIGFAGPRRVPASWAALGLGLTLTRDLFAVDGADADTSLDILITLALTRIAVPFFDSAHSANPLLLIPLAGALALLAEPTKNYLEYSTEIPLIALVGVALRLQQGRPTDRTAVDATALVALLGLTFNAIQTLELTGLQALATAATIATTVITIRRFSIRPLNGVPQVLAPSLGFIGRHTLMIYAGHLLAFQIAAYAISYWE